jgi:uncharacterized membrane protein
MKLIKKLLPFAICFAFFLAYAVLSIVKHNHYLTGYDLGVEDQAVWLYSRFLAPISTTHAYANTSIFWDHVEFIYLLAAPFYWIINSVKTLIILHVFVIASSGLPVYFLARSKKVHPYIAYALLVGYLLFFGIQNAVWSDVHSLAFGSAFLAWFLYFLEMNNWRWTIIFFILAVTSKEDMGLLTGVVSGVCFIISRKKEALWFLAGSVAYVAGVLFVYYPYFTPGYRFQSSGGLLSTLNPVHFIDAPDKRQAILYTFASFGFLPILAPLFLLPAVADFAHYFVIGSQTVARAQGLFGHYRVTLALFMIWPIIYTVRHFRFLNRWYMAVYILIFALFFQYYLHSPLSYLAKQWFWTEPASVRNINTVIRLIPDNASVVSQNNITPHLSHRTQIMTLWPERRDFQQNSPCDAKTCDWFRWVNSPKYMIVDLSHDWDIRHFLVDREQFIAGVRNMEKSGAITLVKQVGDTGLYEVMQK